MHSAFKIYWIEDNGPNYQFDLDHFIVYELENDGANAVTIYIDGGNNNDPADECDECSRLITTTNPITDIDIDTEWINSQQTPKWNQTLKTFVFNPIKTKISVQDIKMYKT